MNTLSALRNLDAPTTDEMQGDGDETNELCGSLGIRIGHAILSLVKAASGNSNDFQLSPDRCHWHGDRLYSLSFPTRFRIKISLKLNHR